MVFIAMRSSEIAWQNGTKLGWIGLVLRGPYSKLYLED
jgi:hypothetical protein